MSPCEGEGVRVGGKEGRKGELKLEKKPSGQPLAKDDYSSFQGHFLHANDRTVNKRLFGSTETGRD